MTCASSHTPDRAPPGQPFGPVPTAGPDGRRQRGGMSHSAGPATPRGLAAELRDAVTPRTTLLVIGALALQLLFIASYVGALHDPKPHHVPFGVAVPGAAGQSEELAARLDGLDGDPLDARTVADEAEARHQIMERKIDGALVVDPRGTTDRLLVASGGGAVLLVEGRGLGRGRRAESAGRRVLRGAETALGRLVGRLGRRLCHGVGTSVRVGTWEETSGSGGAGGAARAVARRGRPRWVTWRRPASASPPRRPCR